MFITHGRIHMSFNQEYYDNLEQVDTLCAQDMYDTFLKHMEREPEDEQELIDWYEAKASSLL